MINRDIAKKFKDLLLELGYDYKVLYDETVLTGCSIPIGYAVFNAPNWEYEFESLKEATIWLAGIKEGNSYHVPIGLPSVSSILRKL